MVRPVVVTVEGHLGGCLANAHNNRLKEVRGRSHEDETSRQSVEIFSINLYIYLQPVYLPVPDTPRDMAIGLYEHVPNDPGVLRAIIHGITVLAPIEKFQ